MASPAFGGRVSTSGVEIGRIVERGLRESGAIDTEALCIVAGEEVWSVRLDIHILDDHGNLTDCCSIAAITALHHFKRPDVTISGDAVVVHSTKERDPVSLSIHHMPISVSFAIFGENTLVVDPGWKEERVCQGKMTITLNAQHELCAMQKAGGVALSVQTILEATMIAQVKVLELSEAIHAALNKDKQARKTHTVSSNELMTSGIGLEQIVQDELAAMTSDSSSTPQHKAIRFFQGLQSVDLPPVEAVNEEYDTADMDADMDITTEDLIPNTATTTKPTPAKTTSAAAKGPVVKPAKTTPSPMSILKGNSKPKAIIPSKANRDVAKTTAQQQQEASSSAMEVDSDTASSGKEEPDSEDDQTRAKNRKAFDMFAAQLAAKRDKKMSKYGRN